MVPVVSLSLSSKFVDSSACLYHRQLQLLGIMKDVLSLWPDARAQKYLCALARGSPHHSVSLLNLALDGK